MKTACPWEYMKTAYNVSNIEKNHMILFCLGFFFHATCTVLCFNTSIHLEFFLF